jgi:flagellar hook assembly protein FlgD
VNETQPAGYHSVIWDGKNNRGESVPSGIYIYKINAGKFKKSLKLLMLK